MGQWTEYSVRLLLMAIFLCCSAYCSGSETAFFSLSKRQIGKFHNSGHRLGRLVAVLMQKPSDLLGALLLGNLIVNTLFFATSSVLMLKVQRQWGVTPAAAVALVTFLCLVLLGEILPKSLAYASPERFSVSVALPTWVAVRGLTPIVALFRWFVAEPVLRLMLGPGDRHRAVTGEEFKALIEATREKGLINEQQRRLFTEVVSFNILRVRHVMRPRVDMVACSVGEDPVRAQQLMIDRFVTTLFVYQDQIDHILGAVDFRQLVLEPSATLADLAQPVQFVPEQKTVEGLLQFFRKMRVDTAVVVDEYGGVAGSVAIEDVAEELFGSFRFGEPMAPIESLGKGRYRLSGSLPIHDWIKAFGLSPGRTGVATVGGWITALLGRIPREKDRTRWRHLSFMVERMHKHRVVSVILKLEETDA